jgi:hypothetical protein
MTAPNPPRDYTYKPKMDAEQTGVATLRMA